MHRAAAALIACACIALAVPARAGAPARVTITAGVAGKTGGALGTILVGSSGQLYRPDAEAAAWKRETPGGVAVTVRGALRGPGGAIVVAGNHTPTFRFSSDAWQAAPLTNRGPIVVGGAGGTAAVAVGRHIYLSRGTRWVRVGAAPHPVQVLWAASPSRIYVVNDNGALLARSGGRYVPIATQLAADDPIVSIAGRREVYALSKGGTLLRLIGTRAKPVARDADLADLAPEVIAPAPAGGVYVVGILAGPPATRVLARASKGALHRESDLPAPEPLAPIVSPPPASPAPAPAQPGQRRSAPPTKSTNPLPLSGAPAQPGRSRRATLAPAPAIAPTPPRFDPVVVLRADRAGAIVAATRRGTVLVRRDSSTSWTQTRVSGDLPPDASHHLANRGPALAH